MRERTYPKRLVLAFAFGGWVVLLWQLATDSTASSPWESPPEALVLVRVHPQPRAFLQGASVLDVSFAVSSSSSRLVKAAPSRVQLRPLHGVPAPPFEASSSSSLPSATVLPLSAEERAPDGLPVSAMRCTWTSEGLDCGSCRTDGDCPAGQGCVANRETRRFECMAFECEEDVHCFPGSVCRPVTTGATGIVVRRCVPEGLRREGEPCDSLPVSSASSCREGLRCVDQVCSAPCSLDGSVRCSSGFVCTDSLEGPGCFPDCQRLGCPDGQACTRVREDQYQCLAASQGDCRETPCPEGERCNMRMSRGRAVFWCAQVCNPVLPGSCPNGDVCGMGSSTASTCFRKCDPMDPESCGPGWSCSTVTEDMSVLGCTPELKR
ncbi:hypothetical protein [Archangium sp.]|uniref:hypothetical protein n=1 Tax=Archangium sp. TaxID=1872627 RepID=UPI002D5BCFC6|nr:hypothetical protein [Archangium sp.]HYO57994.1 hypothetical protein [Archangium sp.]